MTDENKGLQQTRGGLYVPIKNKRVVIYFESGGRTTVETTNPVIEVVDGQLTKLEVPGESTFPFIKLEAVQAIEVIE